MVLWSSLRHDGRSHGDLAYMLGVLNTPIGRCFAQKKVTIDADCATQRLQLEVAAVLPWRCRYNSVAIRVRPFAVSHSLV